MRPVRGCAGVRGHWHRRTHTATLEGEGGLQVGDRRPLAERPTRRMRSPTRSALAILAVANEPRFADQPPARIVPTLADEGVYIASESSFQRVLRAHGQTATGAAAGRPSRRVRRAHMWPLRRARSGAGT
jgi:hypothetical protein